MLQNSKTSTKVVLGFSIPILIIIALSAFAYRTIRAGMEHSRWVEHTYQAVAYGNALVAAMVDQETGERGFALSGDESFLEPYLNGKRAFAETIATAKQHVSDNPAQVARLERIDGLGRSFDTEAAAVLIAKRRAVNQGTATMGEVIELVKARLYGPDGPEKRAAQSTLYRAIETLARLMAPFTPFISEEIFHTLTGESVHVQSWPEPSGAVANQAGLAIKEIAAAIRRYKAEKGMALNSPLPGIVVYSDLDLETFDLSGVANSSVESRTGSPEIETKAVAVKPQMKIIGPRFKDKSHKIINALSAMDPNLVASQKTAGLIRVELEGEAIEVPPEAATVEIETLSAGEAVDILKLGAATVLVRR